MLRIAYSSFFLSVVQSLPAQNAGSSAGSSRIEVANATGLHTIVTTPATAIHR